ncbi:OmpH family outer membrane protein [Akkermansia glycaniphila]|uniref:Chaperone protein skp n=1 Tax=Akkermansia glycaniphila TaxID=1679444 RepID=A0A1H6LBJ2_9BACT|nr:OmpH family outer membrane protein [Akkermansia glycaniphila]MBT9450878.1 OmpH family outer membrane protein [Akkermansia glycaniphila]SEH85713.1 chaperone protein skp [Akkermansia glycaniphila]
MKLSHISFIATAMLGLATTATAAELKVASVDVQDLFRSYYKTHAAQKKINEQRIKIENETKERQDKLKALGEELQKIRQQYNDPTLNDARRQAISKEFQLKQNDAMSAENEYKNFMQRKQIAFQEMVKRDMSSIITEIEKAVQDKASAENFDIVFDSSAVTPSGTHTFVFAKKSLDITPAMKSELNKNAPAGFDPNAPLDQPAAPAAN